MFGGNRSGVNASEADARAADTSLADVQVSLAAEVAVSYIELRGLQARLAIARSNLAAADETLQITRWRGQAGLVSSLDVEQAIAASEQTAAQIPALQTSLAQALRSLAVLTGQAPGTLPAACAMPEPCRHSAGAAIWRWPFRPRRCASAPTCAPPNTASAPRWPAWPRPTRARYPSFRLSGSLGLRALTLGTLTNGASVASALLASVSVPLFDGGAARAQVRSQEAALEQARVAYQATVLTALKDVEDALVALQGDRERLARLQAAADAAANAELLARQRYASGLIDFRTVLDTQRTPAVDAGQRGQHPASLSADHVRLYKALGGGWTPERYRQP